MCVLIAALSSQPVPGGFRYPLIVALAVAMGIQNATARQLAVPDLTIDQRADHEHHGYRGGQRHGSGARDRAPGAASCPSRPCSSGRSSERAFVLHVAMLLPLVAALVVSVLVAVASLVLRRPDAPWVRP